VLLNEAPCSVTPTTPGAGRFGIHALAHWAADKGVAGARTGDREDPSLPRRAPARLHLLALVRSIRAVPGLQDVLAAGRGSR